MASADNWFKGIEGLEVIEGFGPFGLIAGIGAALLAPIVLPVLGQNGKPLVKAALKEGILLYEKGKEAFAEATDSWEDLVAEAKYELAQDQREEAKSATPPTTVEIQG